MTHTQINETFDYKVEILQKALQESLQTDLKDASLRSGADKIVWPSQFSL